MGDKCTDEYASCKKSCWNAADVALWVCSIEACSVIFGYLSAKLTIKPVT